MPSSVCADKAFSPLLPSLHTIVDVPLDDSIGWINAILKNERDPERVGALYAAAVQEHAVLQRSAIVNRLYGGWRLVVENQQPARHRSDS